MNEAVPEPVEVGRTKRGASAPKPVDAPPRVFDAAGSRARFGPLFDRLVPALDRGDPLADAAARALRSVPVHAWPGLVDDLLLRGAEAPPELARLVAAAGRLPGWVDWTRVARGGGLLRRSGPLGGLVLGARSLVYGYAAPAGNKPLMFSGRLVQDTPRRLAETARFVASVAAPGALVPGAEGHRNAIKVRLMHARVRVMLADDPRWRPELWCLPINQHDMLATTLLFSVVFLQGLERLGMRIDAQAWEDYVHMWAWVGLAMGVEAGLLPRSAHEASAQAELVRATQGPPDDDARALVRALLRPPRPADRPPGADPHFDARLRRRARRAEALCRAMIDGQTADGLELARDPMGLVVDGARAGLGFFEGLRARAPWLDALAVTAGARYWREGVARTLRGKPATFAPPVALRGAPRRAAGTGRSGRDGPPRGRVRQ